MTERYPKSTPGFERDRHVTLTIVAHPRVRQSLAAVPAEENGENPCGNRESSRTRTHDRQLHHPEHLPNELRLVPDGNEVGGEGCGLAAVDGGVARRSREKQSIKRDTTKILESDNSWG